MAAREWLQHSASARQVCRQSGFDQRLAIPMPSSWKVSEERTAAHLHGPEGMEGMRVCPDRKARMRKSSPADFKSRFTSEPGHSCRSELCTDDGRRWTPMVESRHAHGALAWSRCVQSHSQGGRAASGQKSALPQAKYVREAAGHRGPSNGRACRRNGLGRDRGAPPWPRSLVNTPCRGRAPVRSHKESEANANLAPTERPAQRSARVDPCLSRHGWTARPVCPWRPSFQEIRSTY